MAMTLLLVIGFASFTGYAGLSTALGAFLAGVLLSETEYRHQIEIDVAPFKGLLVGLFFITVGMSIDVRVVWAEIGTDPPDGRGAAGGQGGRSCSPPAACSAWRWGDGRGRDHVGAGRRVRLHRDRARPRHLPRSRRICPGRDRGGRHQHDAHAAPGDRRAHAAPAVSTRSSIAITCRRPIRPSIDHVVIGGYGRVGQSSVACSRRRTCRSSRSTPGEPASEGAKRGKRSSSATPPAANSCAAPAPPGRAPSS